jgi:hypothetical protein
MVVATGLHNPFGGYVQDDGLYSRIAFLRALREGFPEYADVSDSLLMTKFLAKYPASKTWIREETDGTPPLPLAIADHEANYRLRPPPAYSGARPRRYSMHAIFPWIDELIEYVGFVGPILLGGALWTWLFRGSKSRAA